jgi:hypothetical protein
MFTFLHPKIKNGGNKLIFKISGFYRKKNVVYRGVIVERITNQIMKPYRLMSAEPKQMTITRIALSIPRL